MRRLLPCLLVLASCTSSPCVTPPSTPSGALLSGAVTVFLTVYLTYALIRPERF